MTPQLALAATVALICGLMYRDVKRREGVSSASWLVMMWLVIFASRPVSAWFSGGGQQTADGYLEGSPLDGAMFFILILASATVLVARKFSLSAFVDQNRWMFAFFAYCAVSVLWSDYPFVALKRWFKDCGNVIIFLVLLTEQRPVDAMKAAFVRCAYLLVPLSFLFVRYYPDIGRAYTGWNKNDLMYVGVTNHKNTLGALLLVSCAFLVWDIARPRDEATRTAALFKRLEGFLVLGMSLWLLLIADSATSLLCTVLAVGIYLLTGVKMVKRRLRNVEVYAIIGAALWFLLDSTVGLSEAVVGSLGRDMTLTTRTGAWDIVLANQVNPLIGAGFKSFWAGDRMAKLWLVLPGIVQAHNGYVETYLNGGVLGVSFLAIMLASGFRRIKRHLVIGEDFSRMRFAFWIVALVYNFSEAAFNQLSLLWCVTLLVLFETPLLSPQASSLQAAAFGVNLTAAIRSAPGRFSPPAPCVQPGPFKLDPVGGRRRRPRTFAGGAARTAHNQPFSKRS